MSSFVVAIRREDKGQSESFSPLAPLLPCSLILVHVNYFFFGSNIGMVYLFLSLPPFFIP
jgi:hypothetical protein